MLNTKEKGEIIQTHQVHEKDTGSLEVQIAVLSEQIKRLSSHLKKNPKDIHSKRGLLKMIVKRKKLLGDLKSESEKRYNSIIKNLGLKKIKRTKPPKEKDPEK